MYIRVYMCVRVWISDLPPSQGGRYSGFGNTVEPQNNDSDYWSAWSSVSNDAIPSSSQLLAF